MTTAALLKRASAPVAAAALVLAMSAPVNAGPPAHGDAGTPGPAAAAATEDTDTNDGGTRNNIPDGGDDAHPSGKDRSVERGGSGNQGRAQHDPDDDGRGPDRSNGGLDQPDGPGGTDEADQDGNNGCGNDDDFEDDNEGWCLGREDAPGQQPEGLEVDAEEIEQPEAEMTEVDAEEIEEPVAPASPSAEEDAGASSDETPAQEPDVAVLPASVVPAIAAPARGAAVQETADVQEAADVEVLGHTVTRSLGALAADTGAGSSSTLPRTGAGLLTLAGFGLGLAGIGSVVARLARADRVA